jgi:hypothetical protein
MEKKLWTAIQELIEAGDYATNVLSRRADFEDGDYGVSTPNIELVALTELESALTAVEKLLPVDPETPLEKAVARAEYEEDR